MQTAKLIQQGVNQIVQLPEDFRFSGDEVVINRIGGLVCICSKEKAEELFFSSLGAFTDDYFEALENSRAEMLPDKERESL